MSTLDTLFFPGTEIYSGSQYPIFLLFDSCHLLQPVETVEATDITEDIFTSSGLCQAYTPRPLGENRERFLRLIGDIRERKDDYAAQLSALTVASMSEKKGSGDDTEQGIISSLLGVHGVKSELEKDSDLMLWKSRLVLKIAEILDKEEEEIAMQMAVLDDDQEGLFQALQGESDKEEDTLFSELVQLKSRMSRPSAGSIHKRLQAWSQLYSAGDMEEPAIWLTDMDEAADVLLERYSERSGSPAPVVARFELPANIGWKKNDAFEKISTFRHHHSELLAAIAEIFNHSPDKGACTAAAAAAAVAANWAKAIQHAFPEEETGRTALSIYHLENTTCGELLGKTTNHSARLLAVISWQ